MRERLAFSDINLTFNHRSFKSIFSGKRYFTYLKSIIHYFNYLFFNANVKKFSIPLIIYFKILFFILFLLYYCQHLIKGKNNYIYRNH